MTQVQAFAVFLVLGGIDWLLGVVKAGKSFDLGRLKDQLVSHGILLLVQLAGLVAQNYTPTGSISSAGVVTTLYLAAGTGSVNFAKDIVTKVTNW